MKSDNSVSFPDSGHDDCFSFEETSFWFRIRNSIIGHFIKSYVRPSSTFHDVGGGNGFVSKMVQNSLNLEVTMIEPGVVGCENAKRRGVKDVFNDKFGNLPKTTIVQNVGLFDVLEHIESPNSFLKEIIIKMEDGGFVFATVPSYKFLWSLEDVHAGHYRRYTQRSLKKELSNAGFEVLDIVPFFAFLILPILLLRAIPYRLGLVKSSTLTSDHSQSGFLHDLTVRILELEFKLIKKGLRLPFGASFLVIARKP